MARMWFINGIPYGVLTLSKDCKLAFPQRVDTVYPAASLSQRKAIICGESVGVRLIRIFFAKAYQAGTSANAVASCRNVLMIIRRDL